jgi:hypothetical protein
MKILLNKRLWIACLSIVCIGSCGTQNILTKARKSGILMEYTFPENDLNYSQTQDVKQEIDAMGQIIDIDMTQAIYFSARKNSMEGPHTKLDMKVHSMDMEIDAMGQGMSPDLSSMKGKEFQMVVSATGREVDTHEPDAIVYQVSPDEKSNFGMIFNSMFTDLPGGTVKINDSWTSHDSVTFKEGEKFTTLVINGTHTLKDFSESKGVKCAEIAAVYDGSMRGKVISNGMEMDLKGKITGTGTWIFDIEKGQLVQDSTVGKAAGILSMSMGELGYTRTFTNVTKRLQ